MGKHTPKHLESSDALTEYIRTNNLGEVDDRQWRHAWKDAWIAYADLIAFGERAMRSDSVVVNNIFRFDTACSLVQEQFQEVRTRRFSDATFAVASTFQQALAFAVALAHACLALNREKMERSGTSLFIHLIAPRITIAPGRVLLPTTTEDGSVPTRIDLRNILVGSAIVNAYRLERQSAGGLLTISRDTADLIPKLKVQGDNKSVAEGLRRWVCNLGDAQAVKDGDVFFHRGDVVDVPWLLMRPLQDEPKRLKAAQVGDAKSAIKAYYSMWETSVREFYSSRNYKAQLEVAKHPQAAMRHAVQCWQLSQGGLKPRYQPAAEISTAML